MACVSILRFRAGGRNGRGSRTKICALPGKLTVISVVAELTCAQGGVETFGGGGTQGARKNIDGAVREIGAGVRDLCPVSCGHDLRDVVKARRDSTKATDAGGARRWR